MTGSKEKRPIKTIILSAGQGRRLLPLTENIPKCLLPIGGKPIIEWQIDALLAAGIHNITVVTGFKSSLVEALLQNYANRAQINTIFNPFFEVADNLASCWIARSAMDYDFLLLNGDTIFDEALLIQVLNSASAPITLSVSHKPIYDADDMKVQLDENGWVKHVSKSLSADQVDCESIGLIFFRENGPQLFRNAVEDALRDQAKLKYWYLSIVDGLAAKQLVNTYSVPGHLWCEIDFIGDLAKAEALFNKIDQDRMPHNCLYIG
ncbi:sugar phosphate nucleotidyltransferase [Nitrosospira sp. NpAV]|uniref:phosphocholine cytidylyltransferase family protein n=1 Tax=Nitrosospira sp. NpAV TaxID=58133 RepID=UPI0005A0B46A|nr:phosphocholine cytidylyltransferase family protein [Nitrosospira sp. NpAV]KIO50442.1 nucleotidyltransferase [Nitrosospira sp. NpAV]